MQYKSLVANSTFAPLFNDFFNQSMWYWSSKPTTVCSSKIETDNEGSKLTVNVAGCGPSDVQITVEDSHLNISAQSMVS